MQSAKLNTRLSLQLQSTTQDGAGQPIKTWTEVTKLWADVRYQRGLESIRAGADTSTKNVSVRIRHRAGVTAAMRLVHDADGTVYNIQSTLPGPRKEYIDLVCEVVL